MNTPAVATTYTYTADRQLDTVTFPDGALVRQYDTFGRLEFLTMPGAVKTQYKYYPSGGTVGQAAGQVSSISGPYGVDVARSYYGHLLKSEIWSGEVVGSIARTYDNDFVPVSQTATGSTGSSIVAFGYDNDKLLTCVSLSNCAVGATDALRIARDSQSGQITSVNFGQLTEDYAYNGKGELASKTSKFGGTVLLKLVYDDASSTGSRDALGRVVKLTETIGTSLPVDYKYSYSDGRLTNVQRGGTPREEYRYLANDTRSYALVGAALAVNETVDAQGRLITAGAATFTHTLGGYRKSRTVGTQVTQYTYDIQGNLRTVALPTKTIEYLVDGLGRRVAKKEGGSLTKQWLYAEQAGPVAELDGTGKLIASFFYGSSRYVPDFMVRGGKTYRILSDQLGSPRMVVNVADAADTPLTATYTAFGEPTIVAKAPAGVDFLPFGFAGGMYDADTGLVRFGARDYDAATGRWMSRDRSLSTQDGPDLYGYVGNDPINRIDPSGRMSCRMARFLTAGAVFGAAAACAAAKVTPGVFTALGCVGGVIGVIGAVDNQVDACRPPPPPPPPPCVPTDGSWCCTTGTDGPDDDDE